MTNKEKLIRLLLIGVILSFYGPNEQTKTVGKLRKKTRLAIKSLSNKIGQVEVVKLVQSLDPHWKKLFDSYKYKSFSASLAVMVVWKDELEPYLPDKLIERYGASEPSEKIPEEVDKFTVKLSDDFDAMIKEVLNAR